MRTKMTEEKIKVFKVINFGPYGKTEYTTEDAFCCMDNEEDIDEIESLEMYQSFENDAMRVTRMKDVDSDKEFEDRYGN
jgi:hypothetical protein